MNDFVEETLINKNSSTMVKMFTRLTSEYNGLYSFNIEKGELEILRYPYRLSEIKTMMQNGASYHELVKAYVYSDVLPEDRCKFESVLDIESVIERLKLTDRFAIHYRSFGSSGIHHYCMRCMRDEDGRDFKNVLIGFENEDYEAGRKSARESFGPGGKSRRRKILIVEDNELNREIITDILKDEYEIMAAENGEKGLELLNEHYREISAILLDLQMPVCTGFDFMERTKDDAVLSNIPIIITTTSGTPENEVRCLKLGASDFVSKPYNPDLVRAKLSSVIKLHESVATLSAVEFDDITGLYNRQAFIHHASAIIENLDKDAPAHMVIAEIENLSQLNRMHGEKRVDNLIRFLGNSYKSAVARGVGSRYDGKFIFLFTEKSKLSFKDYLNLADLIEENAPLKNISIKYAIYKDIDKRVEIVDLIDRLQMAVDSIKGNFEKNFTLYDAELMARRIEAQEMEATFEDAIANEEFEVWYQPEYGTSDSKIHAAEALVRWRRKDGELVQPGRFIELFEKDGLIARLDEYVFEQVCKYQKSRREKGKRVVPTSINLSRNSLHIGGRSESYVRIMAENRISFDMVPLELTETAAVKNNSVEKLTLELKHAGFKLYMDDFGSGYSTIGTLSKLPFDVLKIDKALIDQIGNEGGEIVLRHVIAVAKQMGMEVIAEGVEEEHQFEFLKNAECDLIQGYYFSKPVPEEEFDKMLDNE